MKIALEYVVLPFISLLACYLFVEGVGRAIVFVFCLTLSLFCSFLFNTVVVFVSIINVTV